MKYITIKAKEGCWLTQSALANERQRAFFPSISGIFNTEDWQEVDNTFKEQWEREHQPELIDEQ